MANDQYDQPVTNDGLKIGDIVTEPSRADGDRMRIEMGFTLAAHAANRKWLVLLCRTGRELLIRDELIERGVDVFCPHLSYKKVQRRGRWFTPPDRAVFGGYVFINVMVDGDVFHALRSLDGALDVLKHGERALEVDVANILIMRLKAERGDYAQGFDPKNYTWVSAGAKARIKDGPFEYRICVVNRVMDGRVEVLIDMFGQQIKTTMPVDSLERPD